MPVALLDTCGTGGDGAGTVNISTAAAIVVAACGVPVVKHGNRAATGLSGSSDVLAVLGVATDLEPTLSRRCLAELEIVFLFAPNVPSRAGPARARAPSAPVPDRLQPGRAALQSRQSRPTNSWAFPTKIRRSLSPRFCPASSTFDRAAVVTGSDGLDEVTLGRTDAGAGSSSQARYAERSGIPRTSDSIAMRRRPSRSATLSRAPRG